MNKRFWMHQTTPEFGRDHKVSGKMGSVDLNKLSLERLVKPVNVIWEPKETLLKSYRN